MQHGNSVLNINKLCAKFKADRFAPDLILFCAGRQSSTLSGMLKKAVLALAALAVIFALGLSLGLVAYRWLPFGDRASFNSATLLTQVQNLRQLVTVKYVLEKIIVYEDVKWYGDNRVLLVAHGFVKAGIDLSMLEAGDIRIADKKISMALPPPRITDVYLDDRRTEIVERTTGLLRVFDKDLEENARVLAVADLREAAAQNGILNDAAGRARVELTGLFYQLGFTQVEFRQK
jgi:hypothetical protein